MLIFIVFLRSPEWRFIPDHEKKDMGLINDDDGEFWFVFFLILLQILSIPGSFHTCWY